PSPPPCTIRPPEHAAPGAAPPLPRCLQRPMRCRRLLLNHTVECSGGDQFSIMDGSPPATTPPSPPLAEAAARSNPHRRQTARQRPAGSFLGGFRTPALHHGPASETLHESSR